MDDSVIVLGDNGRVIPKKRPMVNTETKAARLPHNYRTWKNAAIISLGKQWEFLQGNKKLKTAEITIHFYGKQHGDIDNLAGSILDALVQAKILKDDKLENVPYLFAHYTEDKDTGYTVELNPVAWYEIEPIQLKKENIENVF